MLPETDTYGTWASSGEIDVLEAVNLGVFCKVCRAEREDTILGTIHFGKVWPGNKFASTEVQYPQVSKGFYPGLLCHRLRRNAQCRDRPADAIADRAIDLGDMISAAPAANCGS